MKIRKNIIIIVLVAISICCLFAFKNKIIPIYVFRHNITANEVKRLSTDELINLGLTPYTKYKSIAYFTVDQNFSYLTNLSVKNKIEIEKFITELNLGYWTIRYYKPLNDEEFWFNYSMNGQMIGFQYKKYNKINKGSLYRNGQHMYFSEFLSLVPDFNKFKKINEYDIDESGRRYHIINLSLSNFDRNLGEYKLEIKTINNEIVSYRRYLEMPEESKRDLDGKLSMGTAINALSMISIAIAFLGSIFILINNVSNINLKKIVSTSSIIGFIIISLLIISPMNNLKQLLIVYNTNMSFMGYIITVLSSSTTFVLLIGAIIFIIIIGGTLIQNRVIPEKKDFYYFFTEQFIKKDYIKYLYYGYAFAIIWLGYVSVFYYLGKKYAGVWALMDIQSTYISTYVPFLEIFTSSLLAAITEEFVFRMFAINIFLKLFKYRWIAVVASALIWACTHSTYAIFPYYIRILEIIPLGIFLGIIYLKKDIFLCVLIHLIIDMFMFSVTLPTNNFFGVWNIILLHSILFTPYILYLFVRDKKKEINVIYPSIASN